MEIVDLMISVRQSSYIVLYSFHSLIIRHVSYCKSVFLLVYMYMYCIHPWTMWTVDIISFMISPGFECQQISLIKCDTFIL